MDYKYFEDFVSDAEENGSLGMDPETITAFDELKELASEPGEAHAIYLLGRFYELGIGIERDAQEGLNHIIEAAEEGDPEAQYELGWRYDEGDGVTEDQVESVKWYSEAAEQGHVWAQVMLGACYEDGTGVEGMERVLCPRVHFKCIIVDGVKAYFGSANLTGAGMGAKSERKRNFENGVLTDDPALVNPLVEQFDSVWRGDFCCDCGRREHCGDPVA